MSDLREKSRSISRRAILKSFGLTPLLLRASPLRAFSIFGEDQESINSLKSMPLDDFRFTPRYPAPSPLSDIFRLVPPGSDEYVLEPSAIEIEAVLRAWAQDLKADPANHSLIAKSLDEAVRPFELNSAQEAKVRSDTGIDVVRRHFSAGKDSGKDAFLAALRVWLGQPTQVETAEFEAYTVEQIATSPLSLRLDIRYDIVTTHAGGRREERVGSWTTEWSRNEAGQWLAHSWLASVETVCVARSPVFVDVTAQALGAGESYESQLLHGADYWRTVLDGAIGVDVYGNNGIAAGDFDNDGFDDLYVCQPAGLPNRLYRNRGDGTFEDVTEKSGVGVLDNTACALFADFRNMGRQDLLVVCGTGPLLFLNEGNGTFSLKRDAFKFARQPQGTFTHAAVADYDRDGRLDIYFCIYMYYLGLDQYHYPIPYYDARNGPPNCLFHNQGDGIFVETTEAAGLNADNDRYSFACAWGDSNSNGLPDLFVANDFGSSQLYRNNGDGTFKVASKEAHVESVGAGMSCCWADFDNDGHQDIYVPSMWEAAGQRVSQQAQFHQKAPESIRELYKRHARGNALYRNQGNGTFKNVGQSAAVEMGRWSWSSDFWDFDHDGFSDLYVSNGYLSCPLTNDLAGFFWRQVVAKSSEDATPSLVYERGWNAINELVRSDNTWHGYARNVMFLNNRDGSFTEVSGAVAMDFLEDSRSFALADIDHDGRLEVILKNRNAPQIRVLHNTMRDIGRSIAFRLRGTKSNRDAVGASITIDAGGTRQTKYLQAGSGFLAQHSKELFFGLGKDKGPVRATVRWPSGASQTFEQLPADHRIALEEGSAKFTAVAFSDAPSSYSQTSPAPQPDVLPSQVGTWLIQPLKAPDFSLPGPDGRAISLSSFHGGVVLLNFWSTAASASLEQLKLFNQRARAFASANVEMLAVNVDDPDAAQAAHIFVSQQKLAFKALFASEEVAGIYNLIYSHLFDRRRDLPIPVSFLLDRDGMIVKVYQGMADPARVLSDAQSIPGNSAERMRKALPFPGLLAQDAFQRNDFTYGVAMYQHGYLDQAAASFQQVISAKPDNADAYYNLGTLNLRRNKLDEAAEYLQKTVQLRPNFPEAWNNLGMMAAQQGKAEEAIRNFQQSISIRPGYAIAFLNLGNVYRRQRDFGKAQESLERALALQPDDPEINYSMGMLFAQQNQMQRANEYLQRALELRPDYPEAMNNLGVLFVRQQNYAKAEEQFKSGIRVAPNFDQSYLNLARLYALQNDNQRAREVLQQLLRLQPENANAKQAMEMLK
jgi:tetratricopeptide (TPR) repeat protein